VDTGGSDKKVVEEGRSNAISMSDGAYIKEELGCYEK
jgi:hypothetical protein